MRFLILICFFGFLAKASGQQVILQGWYWDYPKTANGHSWADTLADQSAELAEAGFTHVWFPPHAVASSGSASNGYDPKDLFIGAQTTGLGTRAALDGMIDSLVSHGIDPVADLIYNHRDGGAPENNLSVEGWIEGFSNAKYTAGDQPFPSDRYRNILPLGTGTVNGAGDYFFKISSASGHPDFHNRGYKVYAQTTKTGFQGLPDDTESEPNGGGDCGQPFDIIQLGVDMIASVDNGGCTVDEFQLTLSAADFNASDTLQIYLTNTSGGYSDHRIYSIWNASAGMDVVNDLRYQTYTDFTDLPSGRGDMTGANFRPNGNPTCLCGDQDFMWFFYDYDHSVSSTTDSLIAYTEWNWDELDVRGLRMDAIKHFPASFVSDMLNHMHAMGKDPSLVVGEWFSTNLGELGGWLDAVVAGLDAGTSAAIQPKIFDFNLRESLRSACDEFGYDVRSVFQSGLHDGGGRSGFNIVTFVNNHDFRDSSGFNALVRQDPILAYTYILTNNQLGVPGVFYPDYYDWQDPSLNPIASGPSSRTIGLKKEIDLLMLTLQEYIEGATSADYLSRYSTPYSQTFHSGFPSTSLVYQLSGATSGKEVVVAINFAGDTLDLTQTLNTSALAIGDTLVDVLARSADLQLVVDGTSAVRLVIPPRSYAVFVEDGILLDPCAVDVRTLSGLIESGLYQAKERLLSDGTLAPGSDVIYRAPQSISLSEGFTVPPSALFEAIINACE